jgi:lantibiotic modifying enzyme
LEELLTELEKSGEICENGAVKWMSVLNKETGEKGYNISLSHGMSSIAAFLIRLHHLNFEVERVDKLLRRTVNYILDQIIYTEGVISYFPSYSKDSGLESLYSRLGWCYGDLGIAHILWQASIVLNNKDLEKTALKILLHNCNRRDLHINFINDAGLCHGSSGVAQIFWNLFLSTGIQEFKEVTDYWLHVTIQMAKYDDGLAGFKVWRRDEDGGSVQSSDNFLEGISGIGLFLLSHWKKRLI